ncbi:MAG: UDP-N-acetylmuramate dehydrogenase [Puniceicoccales bacterium]|jgi:UDP-N-acetylenolpyruvoylglucosamine reductase|nr:UDP-N-acetylmuramate dehydrogenase [Puniceicoccales bacterium]
MSKNICMLGVCGAGMAPLATYLARRGYDVYGWDDYANAATKDLLLEHGVVFLAEKFLPESCDLVVRSSAIDENTDEICKLALARGVKILRRGEFLAKISENRKLLAIVGSHGKTSVTGNCTEILMANGIVFDYIVGGFFRENKISPAGYLENSEWLVAEVDESDGTMENFSPECTIALNYDDDHVCNYGNRENFLLAFENLFARTRSKIFVPDCDATFTAMAKKFPDKHVPIKNLNGCDFAEANRKIALFCVENVFGRSFNLPEGMIGIQRRNDLMLRSGKCVFLNDYAHHPTEVEALLKYARKHYGDHELNIVFQPHRLTRTQQYFAEFARVLDKFDRQFVVELYSAFEKKIEGVSAELIFDSMKSDSREFISLAGFNGDMHRICLELSANEKKQLILFVGAGNILSHAKKFVDEVAFAEASRRLEAEKIPFATSADLTHSFSIGIRTAARICAEPRNTDELASIIRMCNDLNLRRVVIGSGTNILPPDGMINAAVITLKSKRWTAMEWTDERTLRCSCGVRMSDFCSCAAARSYVGAEKLANIPGCIGGAIRMNAGAHGQSISDNLLSLELMDSLGAVHSIAKNELRFAYRTVDIPTDYTVLGATFRFSETAGDDYFLATGDALLEWRMAHQPSGLNFGSVFRNGSDFSAGELIDRAGLKGKKIGDASISTVHANFIIGGGGATAKDVETLIDAVRYGVYAKFKKFLRTEVVILRNR